MINLKRIYIEDEFMGNMTIDFDEYPTLSTVDFEETHHWGLANLLLNKFTNIYRSTLDPGSYISLDNKHKVTIKIDWEYKGVKFNYIISVKEGKVIYEMIKNNKDLFAVRDEDPELIILKDDKEESLKFKYNFYKHKISSNDQPTIIPKMFDFGLDANTITWSKYFYENYIKEDNYSYRKRSTLDLLINKDEKELFINIMQYYFPDINILYDDTTARILSINQGNISESPSFFGSGFNELFNTIPIIIYKNRIGGVLIGDTAMFCHLHPLLASSLGDYINKTFHNCKIISFNDFRFKSKTKIQLNSY